MIIVETQSVGTKKNHKYKCPKGSLKLSINISTIASPRKPRNPTKRMLKNRLIKPIIKKINNLYKINPIVINVVIVIGLFLLEHFHVSV